MLDTAPQDTIFRGVAFAPLPEPASLSLFASGFLGLVAWRRRRRK